MTAILLKVNELETKFFTQEGIVNAVNGISYILRQGETLAIVGESGCGKSVSVLSILRLIPDPPGKITKGEAIFLGSDLLKLSRPMIERIRGKEIGMVFQEPLTSLNPVLTIGRQVTEAVEFHMGLTREKARRRAIELLEMVEIPKATDCINAYPHEFSGGMRQRVMIASALSCSPKILIADEPTTALDVTIEAQILDLAKRLRDEIGLAIIWITHNLGVVAAIADRVLVMYAGYIVEEGPTIDIFHAPQHPYTSDLLNSLPRIDKLHKARLVAIKGSPPDQIALPNGCPYAPRCRYVLDICFVENPPLIAIDTGHKVACWIKHNLDDCQ